MVCYWGFNRVRFVFPLTLGPHFLKVTSFEKGKEKEEEEEEDSLNHVAAAAGLLFCTTTSMNVWTLLAFSTRSLTLSISANLNDDDDNKTAKVFCWMKKPHTVGQRWGNKRREEDTGVYDKLFTSIK